MTDLKLVKTEGASDIPDGDMFGLASQVNFDKEAKAEEDEEE